MAEPNFGEVFGVGAGRIASGATVSEGGLFIPDSVLIAAGLTNPESKSAEAHFTTIVLQARQLLTQEKFDANIDQSLRFENGINQFITRNSQPYRNDQITINFSSPDANSTIDANNY